MNKYQDLVFITLRMQRGELSEQVSEIILKKMGMYFMMTADTEMSAFYAFA
jgi:hypothetical protein